MLVLGFEGAFEEYGRVWNWQRVEMIKAAACSHSVHCAHCLLTLLRRFMAGVATIALVVIV